MELSYDKSALQEYMDDIGGVGESFRRVKDESLASYNSCCQHYTRLYTELEQANRKAYNLVEAAESMQRSADAEYELAMRKLENAEDDSDRESAQEQLRTAQVHRAEAAKELYSASAAYEKTRANLKKVSDVWEKYQPSINSAAHRVEDGLSSFNTLVSNGNRDLGEYIGIMDKAQTVLYDGTSGTSTSDSGSISTSKNSGAVGKSSLSTFRSKTGNTLGLVTAAGVASIVMNIAGKEQVFAATKSGAAKAYREALKSGDQEMVAKTGAMFKASSPEAYNEIHSTQFTKHVTVPYDVTLPNGEKEHHSYELPIIYDGTLSDIPQDTRSFNNDAKAATEWAHSSYSEWRSSLSEDTENAILTYSSTMEYETINGANRGYIPITAGVKKISDDMDKGINVAKLPEETIVYRGVSEAAIVDMALKAGGKLESGIVLEDQGYLSASLVSDTDFTRKSNYIMRLTAVQGLHGAPLEYGDLSRIPRESEILFGRNHNIYIRNVVEAKRSDLIPNSNEDTITVIDGILTI